eukprot:m.131503 g.131503  ORF g.131503 m.131503 type:complete len:309 (-) comp11314_c0_seq2:3301-4227(-)
MQRWPHSSLPVATRVRKSLLHDPHRHARQLLLHHGRRVALTFRQPRRKQHHAGFIRHGKGAVVPPCPGTGGTKVPIVLLRLVKAARGTRRHSMTHEKLCFPTQWGRASEGSNREAPESCRTNRVAICISPWDRASAAKLAPHASRLCQATTRMTPLSTQVLNKESTARFSSSLGLEPLEQAPTSAWESVHTSTRKPGRHDFRTRDARMAATRAAATSCAVDEPRRWSASHGTWNQAGVGSNVNPPIPSSPAASVAQTAVQESGSARRASHSSTGCASSRSASHAQQRRASADVVTKPRPSRTAGMAVA